MPLAEVLHVLGKSPIGEREARRPVAGGKRRGSALGEAQQLGPVDQAAVIHVQRLEEAIHGVVWEGLKEGVLLCVPQQSPGTSSKEAGEGV